MKKLIIMSVLVLASLANAQTKTGKPAVTSITLKSVGVDTIAVKANIDAITTQLEKLRAEVKALNAAKTANKALLRQARKIAVR